MAGNIDEFEVFMAAISSDVPDVDAIKEAILKHPEWLTDEDKLARFFPERSKEYNGLKSLGLEDTRGLKNVMLAAADLHKTLGENGEPLLSDKQLNTLLSFKNPATGETAVDCIQHNLRIAEKKLSLPCIADNRSLSDKISANQHQMEETLESFRNAGILDAPQAGITSNDNTETKPALRIDSNENAENGNNLEIGGIQEQTPRPPLTVQGQTPAPQADEENEAIGENPGKESKGHKPFKFTPVKEGDIIDYMFNDWFLAFVNWGGEKTFNLLDRVLLDGNNDQSPNSSRVARQNAAPTPAPRPGTAPRPATTTPTQPAPTTTQTSDVVNDVTYSGYTEFTNPQRGFPQNLAENIWVKECREKLDAYRKAVMDNVGKPAEQWKLPENIVIPPAERETLNKMSSKQLQNLLKNNQQTVMMTVLIATRAATLQYIQENKNDKIDFNSKEVQNEIKEKSYLWMKDITQQAKAHQDSPNYFVELDKKLSDLDSRLTKYYETNKPTEKAVAAAKVEDFNMTRELFQSKEPIGLNQEKPSIITPDALPMVENQQQSVTAAQVYNKKRKMNLKEWKLKTLTGNTKTENSQQNTSRSMPQVNKRRGFGQR